MFQELPTAELAGFLRSLQVREFRAQIDFGIVFKKKKIGKKFSLNLDFPGWWMGEKVRENEFCEFSCFCFIFNQNEQGSQHFK